MLGYHDAFFACFALFLLPLGLAFFINDKKADEALSVQTAAKRASAPPTPAAESGAGAVAGRE